MRYLLITILSMLICTPIYAVDEEAEKDSTIYLVRGNMQQLKGELIISFELGVERNLSSNETVVLEPIVRDTLGEELVALPKIYINSRKQQIMYERGFYGDTEASHALQRKNKTTQNYHYLEALPFETWMKTSYLDIIEESCGCGIVHNSEVAFPSNIHTPHSLPDVLPTMATIEPTEGLEKLRFEEGVAYVAFPLDQSVVKSSFRDNQQELQKIVNSIDLVKQDTNCVVTEIYIHGYASPEGLYMRNEQLSKERANAIKEYVADLYTFPDSLYNTQYTAEDWEGFAELMAISDYKERDQVLAIIDGDVSNDAKEYTIRTKYRKLFQSLLKNEFVKLRRTDYVVAYDVRFFNTPEEIAATYDTKPYNLSVSELYQHAQSYPTGSDEQNSALLTTAVLFPEDEVANLNAATVALARQEVVAARAYLDKSPQCAERDLAEGVYYLLCEDYDISEWYLLKAQEAGIAESDAYIELLNKMR